MKLILIISFTNFKRPTGKGYIMTKVQLREAGIALLTEHKANKGLTTAITELLEEFAKTANKDTVKRDVDIVVDGNEYRWCNRHEVYEPITNFKDTKKTTVACILASTAWFNLGKEIKTLTDELMDRATKGENVAELATTLNEHKEVRGGRYDFEANALQFPEIEGYIYDQEKFIADEPATES